MAVYVLYLLTLSFLAGFQTVSAAFCSANFVVFEGTSCPNLTIYKTIKVNTSTDCCSACDADGATCAAWLFTSSKNICKLKHGVGYIYDGLKTVKGKITGVRRTFLPLPPRPSAPTSRKPNIIVVLTDDQDVRLGSMAAMPYTMEHVTKVGVNMSNFFVNTPICCPSRSTLLSGRQYHNNKAQTELDAWTKTPQGSQMCMHMNVSQTLNPHWWQNSFVHSLYYQSGYTTGLFGKLLNDMRSYGCDQGTNVPGVDRLFIMCGIKYYKVLWADQHGPDSPPSGLRMTGKEPANYSTSLLGNASLAWIKSVVESGPDHRPFFAWLGPHAPHLPATPAEWYLDHPIGKTPLPKEIFYNYSGADKHSFIATNPSITAAAEKSIELEHSMRLRTLLSVDDIIRDVREYLVKQGEWDNTIVIFTSDHGYSLGQFRIDSHKTQVYDHNTKVPFVIKGPGFRAGEAVSIPVSMADVAPTLLELSGQDISAAPLFAGMDGTSFAQHLMAGHEPAQAWTKDTVLLEYQSIHLRDAGVTPPSCAKAYVHDGPNNTFSAIRVMSDQENLLYAEFADVTDPGAWNFSPDKVNFFELYNVSEDYYMLQNIYETSPASLKNDLHARLHKAIACNGRDACSAALGRSEALRTELVV